jgi:hypothetical protein
MAGDMLEQFAIPFQEYSTPSVSAFEATFSVAQPTKSTKTQITINNVVFISISFLSSQVL